MGVGVVMKQFGVVQSIVILVAYKKRLSNLRQIYETILFNLWQSLHAQVGRVRWTSATVASLTAFSQRIFNILYRGDHDSAPSPGLDGRTYVKTSTCIGHSTAGSFLKCDMYT